MKRKVNTFLIIAIISFIFTSCVSTLKMTSDVRPSGNKFAVIAGSKSENNLLLAQLITDELKKISNLEVMSQTIISSKIRDYPLDIKAPYKMTYTRIKSDFSLSDREKIKEIQKKLGVDYLQVIWLPSTVLYSTGIYSLPFYQQLFATDKSVEIGNGNRSIIWAKKDAAVIGSAPRNFEKAAEGWVKLLAKDMAKNLNAMNKNKE